MSENRITFFPSHSIFGEPFQIRVFLSVDYYKEEVEQESEAEDEPEEEEIEEDPVAVSKPFKIDQCVVCLSKANPFRKCPSCRKSIETKVMI